MKRMSPDSLNDAVTGALRNLWSPVLFFCFYLNAICDASSENKKLYPVKNRVFGGIYCLLTIWSSHTYVVSGFHFKNRK